jgi:N utilization substance protein B
MLGIYMRLYCPLLNAKLFYQEYMSNVASSFFEEDRQLIADLFTEVIVPNEKLYEFFRG